MKKANKQTQYKPHRNGFPFRLLQYLHENGRSSGAEIQERIGLNKWVDSRGPIYYNRASINFDSIVHQLEQRGLLLLLDNDEYELTKEGETFTKKYKKR